MNTLRRGLAIASTVLLGGGYLASQYFYFVGQPAAYAASVDVPAVRALSASILIASAVFYLMSERLPDYGDGA